MSPHRAEGAGCNSKHHVQLFSSSFDNVTSLSSLSHASGTLHSQLLFFLSLFFFQGEGLNS
jgi:hypothetical protein